MTTDCVRGLTRAFREPLSRCNIAGMTNVEHRFGGPWTEIKLDAVEYYLTCYTKALSRRPFNLWYIDAFAGTGDRTAETIGGGLFEGMPIERRTEKLAGSARRALEVKPPFHHFVFIEEDPGRCAALEGLKQAHPGVDIRVIPGNAKASG